MLEANLIVQKYAKPGVTWKEMQHLAENIMLDHLIKANIIKDFPLAELIENRVIGYFFYNGLGHFIVN